MNGVSLPVQPFFQAPEVKSGNACGLPPVLTDSALSGMIALQATAS